MKIAEQKIDVNCTESEVYNRLLSLDGKHILELGCGSAEITRNIASAGVDRQITALEVDEIAYEKKSEAHRLSQCGVRPCRRTGYSAAG